MEVPKKYLCLAVPSPQTSADTLIWWREGRRCVHPRVLDALKDNNYSVSLKLYKDVCVLLKTRRFAQEPTFPRRAATRISSSTQQVL
jgi:hypothetical protein